MLGVVGESSMYGQEFFFRPTAAAKLIILC